MKMLYLFTKVSSKGFKVTARDLRQQQGTWLLWNNWGRANGWLDLCQKNHGRRCNGKLGIEDPFRDVLSQSYFGVIDVIDFRLVRCLLMLEAAWLTFANG